MNLKHVVMLYCVFASSMTNATLLQWDAFAPADAKAVKDESSGLIWLDINLTAGLTYQEAANTFAGWELATASMVESLLDNVFGYLMFSGPLGLTYQFEQNCPNNTECYRSAVSWQNLFGSVTGNRSYQQHSYGLYADSDNVVRMGGTYVNGTGSANRYGSNFSANYSNGISAPDNLLYGTFLVKSDSIVNNTLNTTALHAVVAPSASILFCLTLPLLFRQRAAK